MGGDRALARHRRCGLRGGRPPRARARPRRLRLEPRGRPGGDRPRAARRRGTTAWSRPPIACRTLQDGQPWGQPYAPADGWDWGSNGLVLNNLVVLAVAHELTGRDEHLDAATRGLDYLLGCNALGQSYVTGYGTDFTRHQRTRHFAHDLDPSFPPPPPGALAGGPHSKEYPGFPSDRASGRPPAPAPLPRRVHVGDDERRLHPLERPARVDGRLPHPVTPGACASMSADGPRTRHRRQPRHRPRGRAAAGARRHADPAGLARPAARRGGGRDAEGRGR